jgi:ribonuclease HI
MMNYESPQTEKVKQITLYTDGACDPNPGPGGYGVLLIYGNTHRELSGGFRLTTNNRMEIYAAIHGLEALKEPCAVTVYSDSEYLVSAINQGWVRRWKENNWWRNKREKATNPDLWDRLLALCEFHQVQFVWVRGHSGNTENERCDQLSYQALKKPGLPADEAYEQRSAVGEEKITQAGQPCRKCSTPVIKKRPHRTQKPSQSYYYEYYLYCPNCHTTYLVEEAKKSINIQRLF